MATGAGLRAAYRAGESPATRNLAISWFGSELATIRSVANSIHHYRCLKDFVCCSHLCLSKTYTPFETAPIFQANPKLQRQRQFLQKQEMRVCQPPHHACALEMRTQCSCALDLTKFLKMLRVDGVKCIRANFFAAPLQPSPRIEAY
jgi:hypothetical protein